MPRIAGNKFDFPYLGYGLGYRPGHRRALQEGCDAVEWLEIISENFLEPNDASWELLSELRKRYPMVMHGVSLSIGGYDPLDREYLQKIKKLAEHTRAKWISDHLAFNRVNGVYLHDLFPLPYNQESLRHIVSRIREVQDILQRPFVLENPSPYFRFTASSIPEHEFLAELAIQADCGLLLDVNNIYLSSVNHGFSAQDYIAALPADHIVQIHLGGHLPHGGMLLDNHNDRVAEPVWALYRDVIATLGHISTLVEWDENIPDFPSVVAELEKAKGMVHAE